MKKNELRKRLEFYQDLGVKDLYRRAGSGAAAPQPAPQTDSVEVVTPQVMKPAETRIELPGLAPQDDTLLRILADIGDCKRCRLHEGRNKLVFGVGNEQAKLVFVGEGPGADEDEQ